MEAVMGDYVNPKYRALVDAYRKTQEQARKQGDPAAYSGKVFIVPAKKR